MMSVLSMGCGKRSTIIEFGAATSLGLNAGLAAEAAGTQAAPSANTSAAAEQVEAQDEMPRIVVVVARSMVWLLFCRHPLCSASNPVLNPILGQVGGIL